MKKIILLLVVVFYSIQGFSQWLQNFEDSSITVPNGFPTGWLVTDNGVGAGNSWTVINNPTTIINGTKSASINREEIGMGNTSEDWLILPVTTIPTNGQLRFFAKQTLAGENGTLYQIRISTSPLQNNLASYTVLAQWTETQMNQVFNVAEEKVVNFPFGTVGTNVHIAFVRIYTQVGTAIGGDDWIIDDVRLASECLSPTNLSVNNVTTTTANLNWNAPSGFMASEIEVLPASETATGIATFTTVVNSGVIAALIPNYCYKYYVRSICGNGNFSEWSGPFNFCTLPFESSCLDPIVIASLPYQATNSSANFGNPLAGPQTSSCLSGGVNYQAGNDVFYKYIATEDCNVSFTLNAALPGSSMFIYPNCAGITGPCLAAIGNSTNNERVLNLNVAAGDNYIIVISSSALSPSIVYNLLIQCENCLNKPTDLLVINTSSTTADIGWTPPAGLPPLSYQVAVQPQGSPIPSGAGQYIGIQGSNAVVSGLLPEIPYQFWVRSECVSGAFSGWEGPQFFTLPTCPMPQDWFQSVRLLTSVELNWSEQQLATQWEVFASENGVVPIDGSPLNTGIPSYYMATGNINYTIPGLSPTINYEFYVRSICSTTDFSNWKKLVVLPLYKAELVAFIDANGNGTKDASESMFQYGSYTYIKNNIEPQVYISSFNGSHNIFDFNPANTYHFNFEIDSEYASYYAETPTNFTNVTIATGTGTQTLYFPITILQDYADVDVSITALSEPRPGFPFTHKIIYRNLGVLPASGIVTYTKDNANITITAVNPAASSSNSNGFTRDYSNLLPGETRSIFVTMLVATIPTVNLGDVISNTVSITSSTNDVNVMNNSFTTSQVVVGSYDPNDKNEARGANVQIGQFSQDDYLFYTIRFQNSGTAAAETVRIEDTLNSQYNFASVRMISASHDYTMVRINNKLIWTFNDINLPAEIINEPGSHGYVTFKIKLNPGFVVGAIIPNTAEIYFDFNPPIITNTFQTTFVPNLGVGTFDVNNLMVYPNPAREIVNIQLKNATETLQKITIYDMVGKTILSLSANNTQQSSINVGRLGKGIYLIEITTDTNLKQVRKFIVN